MGNHTKEELEFLKKIGLDPEKLKYRWKWVDEEKALLFYCDVIYPHFNRVPKISEIDTLGYRGFLNAVRRFCRSYNDFVKKAGYTPNTEYKYNRMSFNALVK